MMLHSSFGALSMLLLVSHIKLQLFVLLVPSCLGFTPFPWNNAEVQEAQIPWLQPRLVSISLLLSRARQFMQFPMLHSEHLLPEPGAGLGEHGEEGLSLAGCGPHNDVGKLGQLGTGGR